MKRLSILLIGIIGLIFTGLGIERVNANTLFKDVPDDYWAYEEI